MAYDLLSDGSFARIPKACQNGSKWRFLGLRPSVDVLEIHFRVRIHGPDLRQARSRPVTPQVVQLLDTVHFVVRATGPQWKINSAESG